MSMNNWNPFQTPISLDADTSTHSNGPGLNNISPSNPTAGLSFPMNRAVGNGLSSFSSNGTYSARQTPSFGYQSSQRVTSPFHQAPQAIQTPAPIQPPSSSSFFDSSYGRSNSRTNYGLQSGSNFGDANGFDSKSSTNGWGVNGSIYQKPKTYTTAPFQAPEQFGMFQRNSGSFRGPSQTSPPIPSGGGGDIFSQADMFSVDAMSGRKQNHDDFKTSRWENGPARGDAPQGARETGIIEKLLHSYGFIQCCERQARLFFHFSQFEGIIDHLKIGDPVEFEMTYDRRTGKPIASRVAKISSEVVSQQMQGEERVMGTVTTEIMVGSAPGRQEINGRISYENRGECFFLPYGRNDIEGHVTLSVGDRVSFLIATDQRTGNLAARCVRLENPAAPVRYRGIIGSISGDSGFIERGDVVRQIRFLAQELEENIKVGNHVEFSIQTSNGKELAAGIKRLPDGTVVFEDIDAEMVRGQVLKTAERRDSPEVGTLPPLYPTHNGNGDVHSMSGKWTPPMMSGPSVMPSTANQGRAALLSGRIRYRGKDRSEVEIPFGEADQKGSYSLRHGDWVSFHIATDRRDQQQRATRITLNDESFVVSGEKREQGIVRSVDKVEADGKPAEGSIDCVERDGLVHFSVKELMDESVTIAVRDEVELTVGSEWMHAGRATALRIKILPRGSVNFKTVLKEGLIGEVVSEPGKKDKQPGRVVMEDGSELPFEETEIDEDILVDQGSGKPEVGDKVKFDVVQCRKTKKVLAVRVEVIEARPPLFDPNTEMPPLPPSPLLEDIMPVNLAPILAPVPDTLPSPLKPTQLTSLHPGSPVSNGSLVKIDAVDEYNRKERLMKAGSEASGGKRTGELLRGYITGVKDGFGFIEKLTRDSDVYFRLDAFKGDASSLEVGLEVLYVLSERKHQSGRESADYVTPAPTVAQVAGGNAAVVKPEILYGVVMRPLKSGNVDQAEYCGLIRNGTADDSDGLTYEFGVTSVAKRVQLQAGDAVQFQVEVSTGKAVNVKPCRTKLRSIVDSVKGAYGFLSYETDEGKKLYYNQSDVKDKTNLQVGDHVEFELNTKRNGKTSACDIVKITDNQRPERLISKLRGLNLGGDGKRLKVIRQPRGPDGTKGFQPRGSQVDVPVLLGTSPPSSPVSMASSTSS
ncbi:unnamed protein product [Notodromas monacha]|uniref:Cold shock domain-containing protein E1 n=1 Tax=Notodromas monacha TaxID=399045 RepID=A0A7R9BD21_9CRUS|nr:unnamed protein product [Notodromas monacha]CAG0913069.1 unnamed protein product [Notodromas monacha]